MERNQPWGREPLPDKTFMVLLSGNQCDHQPVVSYPKGTDGPDGIPMVSLPVFGPASYKFKPPLWVNNESVLVSDLLQAADRWLTMLQAVFTQN
ncbi:hypothetical protein R6Q57_013880 [Mikania cordata]